MTLRRRGYMVEAAKKPTYKEARATLLDYLEKNGWTVKRGLKIEHATKGEVKLWFKAQAIYVSNSGLQFGSARSMWVDPRNFVGPQFDPKKVADYFYERGKKQAEDLVNIRR